MNRCLRLTLPILFGTSLLTLSGVAVAAPDTTPCQYNHNQPTHKDGKTQTVFIDECGRYEVGYRLEGSTLHFPSGAKHEIRQASPEHARGLLLQAYGLVGESDDALIRTRW